MGLDELIARLDELKRKRAGRPPSLKFLVYKATKCPMSHIYIPDPNMDYPDINKVREFLVLDKTDQLPYIEHKWDCDNTAAVLRAKAMLYSRSIGENWAFAECESNIYGGHRFNLVVVKPAQALYIEPQTDQFFDHPKRYKFKFVLF